MKRVFIVLIDGNCLAIRKKRCYTCVYKHFILFLHFARSHCEMDPCTTWRAHFMHSLLPAMKLAWWIFSSWARCPESVKFLNSGCRALTGQAKLVAFRPSFFFAPCSLPIRQHYTKYIFILFLRLSDGLLLAASKCLQVSGLKGISLIFLEHVCCSSAKNLCFALFKAGWYFPPPLSDQLTL